jgi:hypothetical protein
VIWEPWLQAVSASGGTAHAIPLGPSGSTDGVIVLDAEELERIVADERERVRDLAETYFESKERPLP